MNYDLRHPPLGTTAPVGELLLANVAIRVELPSYKHRLAVERYEAVRTHIERPESPLHDQVARFYPQGSMAISATITSRKRQDGYDIDIVAELDLPKEMPPSDILDLLFQAVNGEPGSRYHGKVKRQTRCVTVYYEDEMHLDITPSVLLDAVDPRKSQICHAKPEEPQNRHFKPVINSWAFCEWFKERTPADMRFAEAYERRALDYQDIYLREAEAEPVPEHSSITGGKSTTVVALQLLKRNRNIRYAARRGKRMPPSVMLSKIAAETNVPRDSISGTLDALIQAHIHLLEEAEKAGALINVRNPKCDPEDCFTDRWPEDRSDQQLYLNDLRNLQHQLAAVMADKYTLDQKQDLLVAMFGEKAGRDAIEDYARTIGQAIRNGERTSTPSGRVIPAAAAVGASRAAPQHTFFGNCWRQP